MLDRSEHLLNRTTPSLQTAVKPGYYTGKVAEITGQGKVKTVLTDDGTLLYIDDQCQSVPRTSPHTECLVLVMETKAMVTALLLGDNAPYSLAIQNGQLIIDAGRSFDAIALTAGAAQLILNSDGSVQLNGKNIATTATETLTLIGETLALNPPD